MNKNIFNYEALVAAHSLLALSAAVMPPKSSSCWLELRSNAPGLEGPYLQEYNAPYQHLNQIGDRVPQLVVVVGGCRKRQRLHAEFPATPSNDEAVGTICLRPMVVGGVIMLADCELHLRHELPRIHGDPCPGQHTLHQLHGTFSSTTLTAYRLYCDILAPFSRVVVLFVADFCGLTQTLDFLVFWLRQAMQEPCRATARVLLVLEADDRIRVGSVWFAISMRQLRQLRICEPMQAYSMADILKLGKHYINLELFFGDENLATRLHTICEEKNSDPKMAFSATHTAFLLHDAIAHFASGASGIFNNMVASRRNNPVPLQLYVHFSHLLKSSRQTGFDPTAILASALVLDAYPPGMHGE